jgi:Viral BACON domain/Metallo-peptidase family M12B Reprolysin-like
MAYIHAKPTMHNSSRSFRKIFQSGIGLLAILFSHSTLGQVSGKASPAREFAPGTLRRVEELPEGRFRHEFEQLPPNARGRALQWLQELHLPAADVESMHVDQSGGICYGCKFGHAHTHEEVEPKTVNEEEEPRIEQAAVTVSPFPDSLKFHSRPGLTKRIYINFVGRTVTGTAWNTSLGRTNIVALPFSKDSDRTTFNDEEQQMVKRIWQRMAEDFAPFDVDVTTEAPITINNTTAIVLITRNTDANGDPNPSSTAGGVAYVNVFGRSDFISTYSPAWVYHDNLSNVESYIAEAASHEIGHNLGLTHDGTSTLGYYGGHFSGSSSLSDPISWGPLMGTGYDRNVSQWSKGEYPDANNTQDDLATIAGKIGYRTDDHGDTAGTARPLIVSGGTTISSTTPENDPTNSSTANKGVIERNTDVDVFSFSTGTGNIQINVNPWIQPASYRGGNLDLLLELYNQGGILIATSNPATATTASITTSISTAGTYYLHLKDSAAGNPLISPPTGYTAYGSQGQYFISGTVVDPGVLIIAPLAEASLNNLTQSGLGTHTFTVTYSDNLAINVASLGTSDVRVTGPNGYDQMATFVSVNNATNGTPRTATYSISPPGGGNWMPLQNGTYTVAMVANEVQDTEGAFVAAGTLGQFDVALSTALYTADMSSHPGWTLGGPWTYGQPNYGSGPKAGFTGNNVIGHSMSGNYAKGLALSYATTPTITNAGAASSLTLRFQRWLGLRRGDTAILQVSGNAGTSWVTLWSSTAAVSDGSWQLMQYPLPQSMVGSSQLQFRWGLSSQSGQGNSPTAIGWHIDDVELLGGGAADAAPPAASLGVANISDAGSPTHSCTVTYVDGTAVMRSSIDISDLVIVGPAGPLAPLVIDSVGIDLAGDGSPLGVTYVINAPGGTWDATDNGTYTVTLQDSAVADTAGNVTQETVLGLFVVNISTLTPGLLTLTPGGDFVTSGNVGGDFSSTSLQYTLTNTGQQSLNWSAGKTAGWVLLSATGGNLAGGASTTVTVGIGPDASALNAGSYSDLVSFSNLTNNNGNTTRNVFLMVNKLAQSITFGMLGRVPVNADPLPLSATASSGLAVSYSSSNPNVASISGNTVILHSAGTTTITATQAGNGNYLAATPVPQSLTVQSLYTTWTEGIFENPLEDTNSDADPDLDGWSNLMEYAFGSDPTVPISGPIVFVEGANVTKPGSPLMRTAIVGDTQEFHAVFGRRKDYLAAGLTYTVQFSADMQTWTNHLVAPTVLTGAENAAAVDAVSVPFPELVPAAGGERKPTFFRVAIP